MQGPEATAAQASKLEAKRREYAAQQEALECEQLDMQIEEIAQEQAVLAQQRAMLAQEQAQADTATLSTEHHRQAAEASSVPESAATAHLPDVHLTAAPALPSAPPASARLSQHAICDVPARQVQQSYKVEQLFRGDSVAAIWRSLSQCEKLAACEQGKRQTDSAREWPGGQEDKARVLQEETPTRSIRSSH